MPRKIKAVDKNGIETELTYKSLISSPARAIPSPIIMTGDSEFDSYKRQVSWSGTNDLQKNLSLIQSMIETHLDYITQYTFVARTKDKIFNKDFEAFITEYSKKNVIDIYKRFNLQALMRLYYAQKIVFGDTFALKVKNGKLQLIDPQLISKAKGSPDEVNCDGVVVDDFSIVQKYSVCKSDKYGNREFVKLVNPEDLIIDGYYPNPTATRGVSKLLTVMSKAQDLLDLNTFTLIKAKMQSIFGIAIFRDSANQGPHDFNYASATNTAASNDLNFSLKPGMKLSLGSQDKIELLESKTPNSEYIPYLKNLMIDIMASLQLPLCMYDSSDSTFATSRADVQKYKYSVLKEREAFANSLDEVYEHILSNAIIAGNFKLPKGETLQTLKWTYVSKNSFILDPAREIDALIKQINAGIKTRQDVLYELGDTNDIEDVFDQIAEEQRMMKEKNISIDLGVPGSPNSQDIVTEDNTENNKNDEDDSNSSNKNDK